jgi:hypothetical protein
MTNSSEQAGIVPKEENRDDELHVVIGSRFRQDYVIEDDEFVAQRIEEVKAEIDRMSEAKVLSYRLALIKAPDQCDDRFLLKCLRSEYFHPVVSIILFVEALPCLINPSFGSFILCIPSLLLLYVRYAI